MIIYDDNKIGQKSFWYEIHCMQISFSGLCVSCKAYGWNLIA